VGRQVSPLDVFFAVYLAILTAVTLLVLFPALIGDDASPQDVGSPCRDHRGVAQYIPPSLGLGGETPAIVICRDGKVGLVDA
jgi:hypothetical protein